ncbi:hypothetical protein AB0H43_11210 [Hamadaea sp. NPDC050747]|uniref:hypothetical protein n=1 Tax=Hamadaea sp. NPDC050747 TaxID=3155789 RepID=UPI00341024D4
MAYAKSSRALQTSVTTAAVYAVAVAVGLPYLRAVGAESALLWTGVGTAAVAAGTVVVLLVRSLVINLRTGNRPARFAVTDDAFTVPPANDLRWVVVGFLVVAGPAAGVVGLNAVDGGGFAWSMTPAVFGLFFLLHRLWRIGSAPGLRLTPDGVDWNIGIFSRQVPWESLAPGGPPRPSPNTHLIQLRLLRPDLVTQQGQAVGTGQRHAPVIPARVGIDTALLADAIRWYAEHPQDRAAIGTPAEHERLLRVLGSADQPSEPPAPPTPPAELTAATWAIVAGVVVAPLLATAQLILAIVVRPELDSIDSDEFAPSGGVTVGLAGLSLAGVLVAGSVAVLLLRHLRHGVDLARVTLAFLAAAALVWAMCPLQSPLPGLIADEAPPVGTPMQLGSLSGNLAVACLAVSSLVLLLTGPVTAYTRR